MFGFDPSWFIMATATCCSGNVLSGWIPAAVMTSSSMHHSLRLAFVIGDAAPKSRVASFSLKNATASCCWMIWIICFFVIALLLYMMINRMNLIGCLCLLPLTCGTMQCLLGTVCSLVSDHRIGIWLVQLLPQE